MDKEKRIKKKEMKKLRLAILSEMNRLQAAIAATDAGSAERDDLNKALAEQNRLYSELTNGVNTEKKNLIAMLGTVLGTATSSLALVFTFKTERVGVVTSKLWSKIWPKNNSNN